MFIFEKINPFKNQSEMKPGDDIPERAAERSFGEMKPEKEITEESDAEKIIEEIKAKSNDRESVNPIHFFKYKGADLKIGDLKNLEKFEYEIKKNDVMERGHECYNRDKIEDTIAKILEKVDKII